MISWISSFFSCRCPLFDKEPILKRRESETPEDLACFLMERIEEIHLRLTEATQTRVFEFRLERPEHFYEYRSVKTSLEAAQRILSGGIKKINFFLRIKKSIERNALYQQL